MPTTGRIPRLLSNVKQHEHSWLSLDEIPICMFIVSFWVKRTWHLKKCTVNTRLGSDSAESYSAGQWLTWMLMLWLPWDSFGSVLILPFIWSLSWREEWGWYDEHDWELKGTSIREEPLSWWWRWLRGTKECIFLKGRVEYGFEEEAASDSLSSSMGPWCCAHKTLGMGGLARSGL